MRPLGSKALAGAAALRNAGRSPFRVGRLGAVGAALLLAGCAAARPELPPVPPPAPAIVALDEAGIEGIADLLRMEDRRALELDRWTALMRVPTPAVRARAALAAGRIADSRGQPLLLESLHDSTAGVRAAGVFALGRLADSTAAVTEALSMALQGRDSAALQAPAALARVNTRTAYDAVWQRLNTLRNATAPADLDVARECLLALWRFRHHPGAADIVAGFAPAKDPAVRWAAVYALTRTGTPASTSVLLDRLQDPDPLVRATAARGLRAGAADSAGIAAAARAGLQQLLGDPEPHVRINAARALAAFRNATDTPLLLPLLQDGDANVRLAAAEALGNGRDRAASGALRSLATETGAPLALRAAALASLARIDSAAARSIIAEWIAAPGWLQRYYAVRGTSALDWSAQAELLRRLARDPDPRVQGEAFGALAAADTAMPLTPLFLEGLAAPDPVVRANAANGLARRRDPAFFSALMQAFDRAQRDTISDAALAAVDALAALAGRGVPVATSFFLRFPPARDAVVRARVAQLLGAGGGTWGEPRPIETGRSDGFYREVVRAEVAPVLAGAAPPRVRIVTARGDIVLALDPASAPLTVHHFLELIRSGFYRRPELRWHRVVPNFVLQDGDPRGDGSGGPPGSIRDEINLLRYDRGALGMALSGPDTGGSQFFITHSPQPHLDGGYTIFGRVAEGMAVADAIVQDDAILAIEVVL